MIPGIVIPSRPVGLVDIPACVDIYLQNQPIAEDVGVTLSVHDEMDGWYVVSVKFDKVKPLTPAAEISNRHPLFQLLRWNRLKIEAAIQKAREER